MTKCDPLVDLGKVECRSKVWHKEFVNYFWLKIILCGLEVKWKEARKLYYNKKSTTDIAHNLVQHDRTKHVEVD